MIERLLAAERALGEGQLDQAERLFRQVADADERNAIAVVGLAEVALARGDRAAAEDLVARALAIDPDDAAAARLLAVPEAVPEAPPAGAEPTESAPPTTDEGGRSLGARLRAWFGRLVRRSG
ncbi:MAG TPA: tetratricopeptide repeat protein [Candidatus Limnocylindrales bacterium]|nr:tetratricopeptide repeat protein [Candidatus Limnocylindrales bacterium]